MTDQADYPPLRPCPFCGKVPDCIMENIEFPHAGSAYDISCEVPCGTWTITIGSKAEAADKWNRRAKL